MSGPTQLNLAPAEAAAKQLFDEAVELQALTPEAGARRYFRARTADGAPLDWLLVTSPAPAPRASETWLLSCGIRTPRIGAELEGAYLVEDLGDRHLVHAPTVEAYSTVLDAWRRLHARSLPSDHPNAAMALDRSLFARELGLFYEHWVRQLHATRDAGQADVGRALLDDLAAAAADGPWSVQHRDFHSRNLLLPEDGEPAWIDHQDLRPGPLFYDLASLQTDAYLDLPAEVEARLQREQEVLAALHSLSESAAAAHFHATALQRVLKALGTFAMLLGRGRQDYAAAERRAHARALRLLDAAPEWESLRTLLHPSR